MDQNQVSRASSLARTLFCSIGCSFRSHNIMSLIILLLLVSINSLVRSTTLLRYGGMQCNGDDFLSACYEDQCAQLAGIACWTLYSSGYCTNNYSGCWNNPADVTNNPTSPDDASNSWNVYNTTNAPTCIKTCNTNYLACKATYGCGNCLYSGMITKSLHAGNCSYTGPVGTGTWISRPATSVS